MALKYTFRELFFKKILRPQRLYSLLEDLDSRISQGGEPYDDTEVKADISALETAVGDSNSGLVKSVADINTTIGDESTKGTILARIKALEDAE